MSSDKVSSSFDLGNAHVRQYRNPFDGEANIPKIPDDKVESSTGVRVKDSVEFVSDFDTQEYVAGTPGYLIICTSGSSQTFLIVRYLMGSTQLIKADVIYVGNNGAPFSFSDAVSPLTSALAFRDAHQNFHSYRYVSHGLRVQNSSAESVASGVYESRSEPIPYYHHWVVRSAPTRAGGTGNAVPYHPDWNPAPYLYLKKEWLFAVLSNRSAWLNDASFQSGKSKTMSLQLNLPMVNHHRDFIRADEVQRVGATVVPQVEGVDEGDRYVTTSLSSEDWKLLTTAFDLGFEMQMLNLRDPAVGSRFLVECNGNVELIAQSTSLLSQFMTENDHAPQDLKAALNDVESRVGSASWMSITDADHINDRPGLLPDQGVSGGEAFAARADGVQAVTSDPRSAPRAPLAPSSHPQGVPSSAVSYADPMSVVPSSQMSMYTPYGPFPYGAPSGYFPGVPPGLPPRPVRPVPLRPGSGGFRPIPVSSIHPDRPMSALSDLSWQEGDFDTNPIPYNPGSGPAYEDDLMTLAMQGMLSHDGNQYDDLTELSFDEESEYDSGPVGTFEPYSVYSVDSSAPPRGAGSLDLDAASGSLVGEVHTRDMNEFPSSREIDEFLYTSDPEVTGSDWFNSEVENVLNDWRSSGDYGLYQNYGDPERVARVRVYADYLDQLERSR